MTRSYDDAKIAAEAAAAAWKVPLISLVKVTEPDRHFRATAYQWIWQRGQSYVLRRRVKGEADIVMCGRELEVLVKDAMNRFGITEAEMRRPSPEIPELPDEEEMPATQPYPEDVLGGPDATPEAKEQEYSGTPAILNWGAAHFVAATLSGDRNMLPGDIADLESRAAGRTFKLCVEDQVVGC